MSRWIKVDETINRYITDHLEPEIEVLRALREETSKLKQAGMQISHEQARFMTVVLSAMQARLTIEIGVFTGYSTLVTALTLPLDGRVLACDISQEWTRIAQPYWQLGGVADKIDLQLAPATETLDRLLNAGRQGEFDFVFIDADKTGYDDYYERSLQLLRPGGLIMIDNSLWNGSVLDASNTEQDTVAIRKLNEKISQDGRVLSYLAPIGPGPYRRWYLHDQQTLIPLLYDQGRASIRRRPCRPGRACCSTGISRMIPRSGLFSTNNRVCASTPGLPGLIS